MNETTPENSDHEEAAQESGETSRERHFSRFTESLRDTARTGADDAKRVFDEAFPKAKEEFTKGAHDVAYGISYAASFGAALLSEILSDNLRDGFSEGGRAGRRAAEEVVRQREERSQRESEPTPDSADEAGSGPAMA